MCGRFSLAASESELAIRFASCTLAAPHRPRFNIAPGQLVTSIIGGQGTSRIGHLSWGIPLSGKPAARIINARAETLASKKNFLDALKHRRCLIPADGFFEWPKTNNDRLPVRFTRQDGKIMGFAGIYQPCLTESGRKEYACLIITTAPNELVSVYHGRMPAILGEDTESIWLNRSEQAPERLLPLLIPYPADLMQAYRVSTLVNKVSNDCPECIEPIPDQG